jgi:hypothetical protein
MNTNALTILQNEKNPIFQAWCHILKHSPTKAWQHPVLTFIDIVGKPTLNGKKAKLTDDNIEQCNDFMRNIARYIYAKSFADEPADGLPLQQEMKYATTLAEQGKMYEPKIKVTKQFKLSKKFEQKLNDDIPKQLQWGFCAIVEFSREFDKFIERTTNLKPKQTISQILETSVVGQILPNKWDSNFPNNINKWNTKRIKKSLQTIGNLVLIEQEIHKNTDKIYIGNFFIQKRHPQTGKGYKDSIFNDVSFYDKNHIDDQLQIEWFYDLYQERQKQCVNRLIEFFSGLSCCILL